MADRDFEPRPLKEVLSEFSQQKGVRKGIEKVRVEQLWKDTLGAYVYRYTRKIRLEGNDPRGRNHQCHPKRGNAVCSGKPA